MTTTQPSARTSSHADVTVTTRGEVPVRMVAYARDKVAKVYRYSHDAVRTAHVVLTVARDPARTRPASARKSSYVCSGTRAW